MGKKGPSEEGGTSQSVDVQVCLPTCGWKDPKDEAPTGEFLQFTLQLGGAPTSTSALLKSF